MRPVDTMAIAAAAYRVGSVGGGPPRLELWRVRDVGGDAEPILLGLREIGAFHEAHVAPLPYHAFRLVELPTVEGLALSYASLIFMAPGMLAAREERMEVLSHEVGHQWWGNGVTGDERTRWIAEG